MDTMRRHREVRQTGERVEPFDDALVEASAWNTSGTS
jgi:hypothetical protein